MRIGGDEQGWDEAAWGERIWIGMLEWRHECSLA